MFGSLYLLQVLFFHGNLIIGFIIVLIGFLGGLHFYGFLNGFLGGFDDNSLSEFRRGVKVVPITTKMFKYLLKATETGHRLSPWKNRFAVELYTEAQLEAENLTKIENAFQNHD